MSFGFSVGDVVTLGKFVGKVRRRFVDSPDQFRAISEELYKAIEGSGAIEFVGALSLVTHNTLVHSLNPRSLVRQVGTLSHILSDLELVINERSLTERQKADLHSHLEGCRNVLGDLDKIVDKYQSLDANPTSLGGKSRRLWKKLSWEPEDIAELRSRISSNVTLLNFFNGSLTNNLSQATKDGVDRLNRHHDDEERRDIEDWLSSVNFTAQQSDLINQRQEGTGQWLLNSEKFKAWLDGTQQTLLCSGIPGAGKTVMTSIIVEHLWTKFQADSDIGIAYLYCNYESQQEQKFGALVASLLKQLVRRMRVLPDNIGDLYRCHREKGTRPDDNEVTSALHSIEGSYSRTFFVIDALDECINSDGTRKRLLMEIFKYQSNTTAALFATSRFIPEITSLFQGEMSMEIRAIDHDVQKYLDNHINRLPNCVLQNKDLQNTVKAEIVRAVDGMFLLAQLHLESLTDKITPKAIRLALKRLPKGSEALDITYNTALERVESQKEGFQKLAKRVLSWITHAQRQLTIVELQHALAVEIGESELDEENICEPDQLVSVCAGLVTSDQETGVIRLVHYTTQQYFERTRLSWAPNAQADITMTCLTYLSFNTFETGPCDTDEKIVVRLQQNIFLDDAAKNWGHHGRRASSEETVHELAMKFLANDIKIACCAQVLNSSERSYCASRVARSLTGIHLAAYFGLEKIIINLLTVGFSPDPKDEHGRTPLSWAVQYERKAVVKLLIGCDGVDKNSKDNFGQSPLSWAAVCGQVEIIKLLMNQKDVETNPKDYLGQTPLALTTIAGHVEVGMQKW